MNVYKLLAKEFLAEYTTDLRKRSGLTQEEMAECLHITCRSYGDLERGRYCFSSTTLLFLLLLLGEEERNNLLAHFRARIEALVQLEVAS